MIRTKISPNLTVPLPPEAVDTLGLHPGQAVGIFAYGTHLVLVPLREARAMRGSLAGMRTDFRREADRAFA